MITLACPALMTLDQPDDLIGLCGAALAADGDVLLDAHALRFTDPFGMALLGATCFTLQKRGRVVQVSGLQAAISGYLQRMDVFANVELVDCAPASGGRRDRRDALVELTRIDRPVDIDPRANQLADALVGRMPDIDLGEPLDEMTGLNTAYRLSIPLAYVLTELLNNALSHARRAGHKNACVWVASQYYRKDHRLQLAVVDNGCGMLETLRNHSVLADYQRKTDHLAILAALRRAIA
jgi:hypothetical protein